MTGPDTTTGISPRPEHVLERLPQCKSCYSWANDRCRNSKGSGLPWSSDPDRLACCTREIPDNPRRWHDETTVQTEAPFNMRRVFAAQPRARDVDGLSSVLFTSFRGRRWKRVSGEHWRHKQGFRLARDGVAAAW